ncbi:putative RNA-binding protein YlmH [Marinithermofilum abyssi]|uniref:Putative RNA-binding protein YlmH n=1 Tax=Marinithermofilum abyssi TaxID=1571185 RepID=A0A8J2VC70_9BACL|nr:YlmH/Sll1252 family protein [Marinithermofilum abyssi]GGE22417.1 putative RNA-binding protein YlmH [Marinithermofilum abyssi]
MAAKEALFTHFRPEERILAEKVLDWMEWTSRRYQPYLTFFLNPRERVIVESLIRRDPDLGLCFDGGYEHAERCRGLILPPYMEAEPEAFELSFLHLESANQKELQHSDVLGSLLGLGIKREKVGDILPHEQGCHVVLGREMADFVRSQLDRVGRTSVLVREISRSELIVPDQPLEGKRVTVASLRVDAVASEGFSLSRSKAVALIKSGKCKVNWKVEENPAAQVETGDVISLRGFGRLFVGDLCGTTKKGRQWVEIKKYQ